MGSLEEEWLSGKAKSITFCVTENCNLACKYCYMTGKNSTTKLDFETAKKAVDYILSSNEREFDYEGVIWEFIGGEPFLEIELIDKVSDYIKIRMFTLNHKWFDCYRFSFSSNGLLYTSAKVQQYIKKNSGHISIGISIDGNKIKHDLQRVKPDGSGSYDDVVKNALLWIEQFPKGTTKATFAQEDIPYLKDSIISLWDLGIKMIPANVVFENVWNDGDDLIFEKQLKELADYVIEKKIWTDHSVRFFDPRNGFPSSKDDLNRNYCGSGKMLAIDCKGNLFPCIRFYDMSLNNRKAISIGDVENGIDTDKVRPFELLSARAQSTDECINCEVATGCSWCTGGNYDCADTDTIYQRSTFICKMHKATVRATKYFWERLSDELGYMPKERQMHIDQLTPKNNKYLQFISSDTITPHCRYRNWRNGSAVMSNEVIEKGLSFAKKNGYNPVFLGEIKVKNNQINKKDVILLAKVNSAEIDNGYIIPIFDNEVNASSNVNNENSILLINRSNISNLFILSQKLFEKSIRINFVLEEIELWTEKELEIYEDQLGKLVDLILKSYRSENTLEINVLNDLMMLNSINDCGAGITSFSVAPNGKIYFCPAFYFDNPESHIGSLEEGINIKNSYLLDVEKAPICNGCDVYSCSRCKFLNKKRTNEINTPSKMQCVISHIERNKARDLQIALTNELGMKFPNIIAEIDYLDPLDKLLEERKKMGVCM